MDRYKYTEVLQEDGTYSTPMPIKVNAENVIFEDNDTVVVKLNQKAIKKIYGEKNITFSDGTPLDESQEYFIILNGNNDIANVGVSLLIGGEENTISGDCLIVMGSSNIVEGNCDNVYGDNNKIKGKSNIVHGDNNIIEGNNNIIFNKNNNISGQNNFIITGSDNNINGNNNSVFGDNHNIDRDNTFALGKGCSDSIINDIKIVTNGEKIINRFRINGDSEFKGTLTANKLLGKMTLDKNNQAILNYIKSFILMSDGSITYYNGNGEEIKTPAQEKWDYFPSLFFSNEENKEFILNDSSAGVIIDDFNFYNDLKDENKCIYFFQLEVEVLKVGENNKAIIKYDIRLEDKTISNFGIPAKILTKGKHLITVFCPIDKIEPYEQSDENGKKIYKSYNIKTKIQCSLGEVKINSNNFCSILYGLNMKRISK